MSKKHLSLTDRAHIEAGLYRAESIYSIAKSLGRSVSTISREIKNNRTPLSKRLHDCKWRRDCDRHNVCGSELCRKDCKTCNYCQAKCSDYSPSYCDRIEDAPFVCNGCKKYHKGRKNGTCEFAGAVYSASNADAKYRDKLVNRRSGFDCTLEELDAIDKLVSPILKNGGSIYHATQTLGERLPVSASTLYRMVEGNELEARNIDLRDRVKRKPRRKGSRITQKISIIKVGHMWDDYLKYISENEVPTVQMDCVEGKKDEPAAILTLHFTELHYQIAIIMDEQASADVVAALDKIEVALGKELFAQVFPLILTDNGHEFTDIDGMERSVFGGKRTMVFFCEPNRSDEKGACENNHKYMRYIIPKGISIQSLSQDKINLMMNHVNSFKRKSIFGRSPFEIASSVLPEDFFVLLGLYEVPGEEVILKPELLK